MVGTWLAAARTSRAPFVGAAEPLPLAFSLCGARGASVTDVLQSESSSGGRSG